MKRDKEIEKASVEYQMSKNPMALGGDTFEDMVYRANINPSFIAGAKWADKTIIDKICKFIESNVREYHKSGVFHVAEFIKDLRKYVEE